jgi:formate dehydrogenase major subunit
VGCAVDAVVENGVWVRQEPVFDSPINLGAHCAKGAALREHGHGEYRLKYPMKLVDGKYQRISWDTALNEISARMLDLRKQSGPDAVFIVGSSKHNNEQAYLLRKWVSLWGSNNCDHQARICHSTTVAGAAVLAARALPTAPAEAAAAAAAAKPAVDDTGGYQLTRHVLRYYETAKV